MKSRLEQNWQTTEDSVEKNEILADLIRRERHKQADRLDPLVGEEARGNVRVIVEYVNGSLDFLKRRRIDEGRLVDHPGHGLPGHSRQSGNVVDGTCHARFLLFDEIVNILDACRSGLLP